MTTESIIDFDNHLIKCRCCLREFEAEDTQIKITEIVRMRFQEITQLEVNIGLYRRSGYTRLPSFKLKSGEEFSNVVCESCNKKLRTMHTFRNDIVFKQKQLYLISDQSKIRTTDVEIKLEPETEAAENYQMYTLEYLEDDEVINKAPEEVAEDRAEDEFHEKKTLIRKSTKNGKKNYKR